MDYVTKRLSAVSDQEKERLYLWWSRAMQNENLMVSETPQGLRRTLLDGVITYNLSGDFIGAAGIYHTRNKEAGTIFYQGTQLAELGSNYVSPEFRGQGIARHFLIERIKMVHELGMIAVSITANPRIQAIFESLGASPMTNQSNADWLRIYEKLCICQANKADCKYCPLKIQQAWVFDQVLVAKTL